VKNKSDQDCFPVHMFGRISIHRRPLYELLKLECKLRKLMRKTR